MAIFSPSDDTNYFSSRGGMQRAQSPQPLSAGGGGGGASQLAFGGGGSSTMEQPGRNPFSALFDPSRSGITGLIGRAMGNPTREEAQFADIGNARMQGVQKLAHAIAQGTPPQQAILEFVNTPEGMEFMMKDPDPMGTIKGFIDQAQAPAPGANDVEIGGNIVRPNAEGAYDTVYSSPQEPTEKVSSFTQMAELAQLEPDEIRDLARAQLAQDQAGDPTETEAATARLVEAGLMTPVMRDQILSGQIKVMDRKNKFGETEGFSVINTVEGTVTDLDPTAKVPQIGDEEYAPGVSPGTTIEDIKALPAGQSLREVEEQTGDPADIVRGAGLMGVLGEAAGGLFGQQFPELAAKELQSQRNGLRQVLADAQNMRDLMSQNSRSSTVETKRIESMVNTLGTLTGPINAAQSLIDWHDYLDDHEANAQLALDDDNTTDEERGAAAAMLNAISRSRANLPPLEDLQRKMKELEQEPGMLTKGVTSAIETGKGILQKEGVIDESGVDPKALEQGPAKGQFATAKEAFDAYNKGTIKVGDIIVIGGKRKKVTE